MKVSNEVSKLKGVSQAAALMATPLNKRFLTDAGFEGSEVEKAGPDDLIIAIEAATEGVLESSVSRVEEMLSSRESMKAEEIRPRTLASAVKAMPDANLALISVPGRFAKREAMNALESGLDVFLFSSNVPHEDEVELKEAAKAKSLLVMGPDCGTSIINGVVLGFGNVVRRGPVGIVSASGTGIQQVSTLLDDEGLGISHAIGTGGNDLSERVGGMTTMEGIRLLEEDEDTRLIVLISKPPGPKTSAKVLNAASRSRKPVVVNFLGEGEAGARDYVKATTLEDAARMASGLVKGKKAGARPFSDSESRVRSLAQSESSGMSKRQRYIRGLYSGGTLCYESQVVLAPLMGEVFSNAPLKPESKIEDANVSRENTCIDMGSEEFVVGRPHPMIDYSLRKNRILEEAREAETAVVLLDVVLGYGSNEDPARELRPTIVSAKKLAEAGGRYLSVVASIIGTREDPQDIHKQAKELASAGVVLMPSNAQAARFAALVASKGAVGRKLFGNGR
jgi:FdrA protein